MAAWCVKTSILLLIVTLICIFMNNAFVKDNKQLKIWYYLVIFAIFFGISLIIYAVDFLYK